MYLYKQRFVTPPVIYKAFRWYPYRTESEENLENNISKEAYKWNPYDDKPLTIKDEEVLPGNWIVIRDENTSEYSIFDHHDFLKNFEFYGPQTS